MSNLNQTFNPNLNTTVSNFNSTYLNRTFSQGTNLSKLKIGGEKKEVRYRYKKPENFKNMSYCELCERKFKLTLKKHHCRLCARSVCKDCSAHRIDENRIGDVCFTKHKNKKMEIQKKSYLRHLAKWTKDLDKKIKQTKYKIGEKEQRKDRLTREVDFNMRDEDMRIAELEKTISNLKIISESKQSERASLEEAIRRRTDILNESNLKLRDLESQIMIMELSLNTLESQYLMKFDKKTNLQNHVQDLRNCAEAFKQTGGQVEYDIKMSLVKDLIRKSITLREEDEDDYSQSEFGMLS